MVHHDALHQPYDTLRMAFSYRQGWPSITHIDRWQPGGFRRQGDPPHPEADLLTPRFTESHAEALRRVFGAPDPTGWQTLRGFRPATPRPSEALPCPEIQLPKPKPSRSDLKAVVSVLGGLPASESDPTGWKRGVGRTAIVVDESAPPMTALGHERLPTRVRGLAELCLDVLDGGDPLRRDFLRGTLINREREAKLMRHIGQLVATFDDLRKANEAKDRMLEEGRDTVGECLTSIDDLKSKVGRKRRKLDQLTGQHEVEKKAMRAAHDALQANMDKVEEEHQGCKRKLEALESDLTELGKGPIPLGSMGEVDLRHVRNNLQGWLSEVKNELFKRMVEAKAVKATEEVRLCMICMDADRNALLMPCNHVCSCYGCAVKLSKCPICRRTVTGKDKIFL